MTIKELKKFFSDHLVPASVYNLSGGNFPNRICLSKESNGWDVYFSERKDKIGLMHFATESEACARMKEEVCKVMEQIYGVTWRGLA